MGLNIISNFAANRALTNLTFTSGEATRSVAKLSSGSRVVTAADDAASLAIGSRLKAEVVSLDQAVVNAGQATSLLQVADGALARTQDILTRLKALSVQAGSQNLADAERALLDVEFQNLVDEIDRIAFDTEFNSKKLLINQNSNLIDRVDVPTGLLSEDAANNGVINVTVRNFLNDQISDGGDGEFNFSLEAGVFTDTAGEVNYGAIITADVGTTNGTDGQAVVLSAGIDPGIVENAGQATADLITGTSLIFRVNEAPDSAFGGDSDAALDGLEFNTSSRDASILSDVTKENGEIVISVDENFDISGFTNVTLGIPGQPELGGAATNQSYTVQGNDGAAAPAAVPFPDDDVAPAGAVNRNTGELILNANTGANSADQASLSPTNNFIFKVGSGILPAEDNISLGVPGITVENLGLTNSSILTNTLADSVSETLTQAIDFVVKVRADIGSSTNRLDFASRNIQTTIENTEAARSTLLDLDVAREITTFTSQQILVQAGISVLAQANQLPQNLLRLFA